MKIHKELLALRQKEKQITGEILGKLQVMENKKAYLPMGYSSLFDYLVRGLKYSEATAYQRQACVRLANEVPEVKQKIDQGVLTASAVTAVFKHIRKQPLEAKRQTLKAIENKSTREVKKLFMESTRGIQIKRTEYLDRVHLRLELTHEQNQKLEKLKALKSHQGTVEALLEKLIDKELKSYLNTQFKITKSKNPRQISKRLRNSVLEKAKNKCQFPGCEQTHYLQIDHRVPVRLGGRAEVSNLQVLCGAHNRYKG